MKRVSLLLFLLGLQATSASFGATISWLGNLSVDDGRATLTLTVPVLSGYQIESVGYAGGTTNFGPVGPGGFDPILTVFSGIGPGASFLAQNDDSRTVIDPATGSSFDPLLLITLGPGDYTLVITQYDSFAIGPTFGDGFDRDGQGNFTSASGCSNGSFCDVNSANRTNVFAVNISEVPEPSTWALIGLGSALLLVRRRLL